MTCPHCITGFVVCLYDEQKCLNCGWMAMLMPVEVKAAKALQTIIQRIPQPKPVTCSRCNASPAPGKKMCERHLAFYRGLMREVRKEDPPSVNTPVLTSAVCHGTQIRQGV